MDRDGYSRINQHNLEHLRIKRMFLDINSAFLSDTRSVPVLLPYLIMDIEEHFKSDFLYFSFVEKYHKNKPPMGKRGSL